MVQSIKFIILTFFILSCSTSQKKALSDSEEVRQIKNTYWQLDKTEERKTFKKGSYEFETKIKGESCASCIEKAWMGETILGNLSDSLEKDGVAIIYSETGGSGTFVYLNLYVNKNGKMVQSGYPIFLGDRIKVKNVTIKNKKILLDLITHGKGEPLCCPTTKETQKFELKNGQLRKIK